MSITELITIFCIGLGLAMDAFAVSVVSGSVYKKMHLRHGLRMAIFFGVFQAAMPFFGFIVGKKYGCYIEPVDHWIAFGLLSFIGGKMIFEAFEIKQAEKKAKSDQKDPSKIAVLLILSIATSIDALAVGFTLFLITNFIFAAITVIGLVTFATSYLGWEIGRKIGHFFEIKIEAFGGLVLILIGTKILIQHLFFMH